MTKSNMDRLIDYGLQEVEALIGFIFRSRSPPHKGDHDDRDARKGRKKKLQRAN